MFFFTFQICSGCIVKRRQAPITADFHDLLDDTFQHKHIVRPDFGPIHITAASTTIILDWYKKAKERRAKRARVDMISGDSSGKSAGNISNNERDNKNYPFFSGQRGTNLAHTTRAIAINWSQAARARLHTRAREVDRSTKVKNEI